MANPETVYVVNENGKMMINKEDFDSAAHTLFSDDEPQLLLQPVQIITPAAAVVGEIGPEVITPARPVEPVQILAAPPAAVEPVAAPVEPVEQPTPQAVKYSVSKTGKKFYVLDASGNRALNLDGYKTEVDAWQAVAADMVV